MPHLVVDTTLCGFVLIVCSCDACTMTYTTHRTSMERYDDEILDSAAALILACIVLIIGIPVVVWLIALLIIQTS
jgi:hypothetical protein